MQLIGIRVEDHEKESGSEKLQRPQYNNYLRQL